MTYTKVIETKSVVDEKFLNELSGYMNTIHMLENLDTVLIDNIGIRIDVIASDKEDTGPNTTEEFWNDVALGKWKE